MTQLVNFDILAYLPLQIHIKIKFPNLNILHVDSMNNHLRHPYTLLDVQLKHRDLLYT